MTMHGLARAAATVSALCFASAGAAQTSWPDKPLRIIVPFPPGGGAEFAAGRLSGGAA